MGLFLKTKFKYPFTNIKTEKKALEKAPIPHIVKIPLLSAKNKLGEPIVKQGNKVSEGDPIGKVGDFYFYSSISGIVKSIFVEEKRIDTANIVNVPIIEIEFTGKIINWGKKKYDYLNRSIEELKAQIIKLGVENLNPTSSLSIEDILNFPLDAHLIVSAIEFSPIVSFNEELLLQKTEEIHSALSILEYIIHPSKTTILVNPLIKNEYFHPQKEIKYLSNIHPNGFESSIFKHFVDTDFISLDIMKQKKVIIIDVQTLFNIYNAIVLQKPYIEQIVTIDGKVAKNSANYFIRLGMPIKDLIFDVGIYNIPNKVVSGNIFNGNMVYNLEQNITAHTYGLFLLDESSIPYSRFEDCIQCNLCHDHCPVDLLPYDLAQGDVFHKDIHKCIDCGICSYVCPARIPLGYFLKLKKEGHYE